MQAKDSLLRRPHYEKGVEFDNCNQILLKPEVFANLLFVCTVDAFYNTSINDDALFNDIKKALLFNEVIKNYQSLLKTRSREFKKSFKKWNFKNELLLFREHIYVSKELDNESDFKRRIVQLHYNLPLAEHFRR